MTPLRQHVTFLYTILLCLFSGVLSGQEKNNHGHAFEQLGTLLPGGNNYRNMDGSPGPAYWQQRCDYDIDCTLDPDQQQLTGKEKITYYNQSPQSLNYLWLQLDENEHAASNDLHHAHPHEMKETMDDRAIRMLQSWKEFSKYGHKIKSVTDAKGNPLKFFIDNTVMRIDLPAPLAPGQQFKFNIEWSYVLIDRINNLTFGRGGYEYFEKDQNYLFTMTQWYPRLCVFSDFEGWQSDQFTGTGEFALTFGNFNVKMTLPSDFMVGSTGVCQNYNTVLSADQRKRWQQAQTAAEPVEIVTLAEAKATESKEKSKTLKTWIYKADNVRDFAWTASRKFVWDAMAAPIEGKKVMAMSYYAKEAYPIYSKISTKAVAHTLKTYSHFAFPYPYPVAISVEGNQGMEYPMISFNPGRAEKDGTYSEGSKNAAILVIIHEVGHTFFPMIVNSDERQWTWMDEGLNSYLQYLTQELWDNKFPSDGGPAFTITDYMKLPKDQLEPIMTNSENINNFGSNAYDKVATGLNILRETIVGRELFDNAFREYARRWMFKSPTPADLFRTIEDATGEDLDWFWRGWFYGIEACDISIDSVKHAIPDVTAVPMLTKDSVVYRPLAKPFVNDFEDISKVRNREDKNITFQTDADTTLRDFYWNYARGIAKYDSTKYPVTMRPQTEALDEAGKQKYAGKHLYEVSFSNKGGLVMPIIIEWTYKDGSKEIERIPAQVWRKNEKNVIKTFLKDKEVASIKLDPYKETADIDETNNSFGDIKEPSKFKLFKQKQNVPPVPGINPMQKAQEKKGF
jgi:hypothetical protein